MSKPKATKQQTPAEQRLSEIWRSWGIDQADAENRAQQAGLDALTEHLRSGPTPFVRGMQALLVDPDRPAASKMKLFHDLWPVVEVGWASAGAHDRHVMLLQAMLAAVEWPAMVGGSAVGVCALSPWMVAMRGRERQSGVLERWRDERAAETLAGGDEDDIARPLQPKLVGTALQSLEEDAKPESILINVNSQRIPIPTTESFEAIQRTIQGAIREVHQNIQCVITDTQQCLSQVHEFAQQRDSSDTLEYLWWGQARYCQIERRPYRRIADRSQQIWLAALEASERASTLPVEPAAAYLQEVLHGLGVPLDERQPLHVHVASLQRALQTTRSIPLPPSLTSLIDLDAFGLPVCCLISNPSVANTQLHENLGVAADTEIDLGEWIAWQFRELVLVRRWPEQA